MNIDFQKLFYRVTPLLCCVILLLSCFTVSASAVDFTEVLDYNDFITNVSVDGDNDIVTVTIPVEYSQISIYSNDVLVFDSRGGYASFEVYSSNTYRFVLYGMKPVMSLTNIPDGTIVTQRYIFDLVNDSGYSTPADYASLVYYDDDFNVLSTTRVDSLRDDNAVQPWDTTASFEIAKPVGASSFNSLIELESFQTFTSGTASIQLLPMTLTMSISSLYRLQEETGRTNELLQLVLEKLEQMEQENLTWYEKIWQAITDGFAAVLDAIGNLLGITPEDAAGAEQFEQDAADKSDELKDKIDEMDSIEKPNPEDVQTDVESVLPTDGAEYVGQTMNVIVENPIISNQLAVVVILMFASYVLFGKKAA